MCQQPRNSHVLTHAGLPTVPRRQARDLRVRFTRYSHTFTLTHSLSLTLYKNVCINSVSLLQESWGWCRRTTNRRWCTGAWRCCPTACAMTVKCMSGYGCGGSRRASPCNALTPLPLSPTPASPETTSSAPPLVGHVSFPLLLTLGEGAGGRSSWMDRSVRVCYLWPWGW